MNTTLPIFNEKEQELILTGEIGDIEVLTALGNTPLQPIIGVICHPLPIEGGTMHNKVVTTIHRAFQQLGISTLRFNFRGVGKSTGSFTGGDGETQDLLIILNKMAELYPQHRIWLAGFSFGSYVAANAALQFSVDELISIAPPVNHYNFTPFSAITCPWLVIQGGQDEIVPAQQVTEWVTLATNSPTKIDFPDAGHFFHGKLVLLREALIKALAPRLTS